MAEPVLKTTTFSSRLRLFELARVLVRLDHVARFIVDVNHSIMRSAEKLCVADSRALFIPVRGAQTHPAHR
jgi:hypothetical protein